MDNIYEETRKRISRHIGKNSLSDKEIIEFLSEEIKSYRRSIENKDRIIKELSNRTIESKEELLETCSIDQVEECIVTRWYEDGVLMKEEIKPYKQTESTCPPIP